MKRKLLSILLALALCLSLCPPVAWAEGEENVQYRLKAEGGEWSDWKKGDLINVPYLDPDFFSAKEVEFELLDNITTDENWKGPIVAFGGQNVTIDGKNHKIKRGADTQMFTIGGQGAENATVTLKNIVIDGGAVWSDNDPATRKNSGSSLSGNAHLFEVTYGGKLILESGAVLQNSHLTKSSMYGAAVSVGTQGGGTLIMKDGSEIKGNTVDCGAVYVWPNSTFTMEGGKISGNYGTNNGGAVCMGGGTFTMSGGEISGNKASAGGGGVSVFASGATFKMTGGTIKDNTIAGSLGGGVLVYNGSMSVSGSPIVTGNTSANGANKNNVYLNGKTITIDTSMTGSAKIGVTKNGSSPISVTGNNTTDYSSFFESDNEAYEVKDSGETDHNVQLLLTKPLAPALSLTVGTHAIQLTWTGPDITAFGDYSISKYEVSINGQNWIEVPADTPTYTFKGLDSGTEYTLQVRAVCTKEGESVPLYSAVAQAIQATAVKVKVEASPAEGGTVTSAPGSGTYLKGTEFTVTAEPAEGYRFAGWKNGETVESTDTTYTFVANADTTLIGVFEKITYNVTVTAGPGGTVTGQGAYEENTEATVTATPNSGYRFVKWTGADGAEVSTDASYTFTVTADTALTAVFEKIPEPPKPTHTHDWSEEWSSDEGHHWHECLGTGCGITADSGKNGYGAHTEDGGTVTAEPTIEAPGVMTYRCTVCGHERTEEIPKLEHVHEWSGAWSADGVHHWHECAADGCPITDNSQKDGYGKHLYDGPMDTDCNVCGYVWTVLPEPELPGGDDGEMLQLVSKPGISEVPPELLGIEELNTPAKVEEKMRTELTSVSSIPEEQTAVYDVSLMVSTDNGKTWVKATEENFPASGLTVTLPYPDGTNMSYEFTVVHMFTTSFFGKKPGETEKLSPKNTPDGIQFTVTGLSPISIGWTEPKPVDPAPYSPDYHIPLAVLTYPVTVAGANHGEVSVDMACAARGDTVTVTVSPEQYYSLESLTVLDENGGKVKSVRQDENTFTFEMPGRGVSVEAQFVSMVIGHIGSAHRCPARNFIDLDTSMWYHDAVDYVLDKGIMDGFANGRFNPDDTLTRAQLAQILYNAQGKPYVGTPCPFADASGTWYADAVRWACARGIVNGYGNGTFGGNDPITREQLAVMLWRYAGSPATASIGVYFNDAGEVSGYALDAVRWAVKNGILNGDGLGQLDPKGMATRAQAAQMLKNFMEIQ